MPRSPDEGVGAALPAPPWLLPGTSAAGYGYNSHVGTVNIAELKNQLSSFLHRVRAGEELVVRDRNLPIAKIVPLSGEDMDAEELSLVASGQMTLPKRQLDTERFWAIGRGIKKSSKLANAIQRAIATERADYGGLLGHKRNHSHLRARAKRKRS